MSKSHAIKTLTTALFWKAFIDEMFKQFINGINYDPDDNFWWDQGL